MTEDPSLHLPALIVVCGAPATGKTTLARRLASNLRSPLLEKDATKESLADTIGTPDRDHSRRLGFASTRLLYDLATSVLRHGTSLLVECNFDRSFASADLERISTTSRVQIVQCWSDRETIVRRYRDRFLTGERHGVHFDLEALPGLIARLDRGAYDLSTLGYPAITVDTTDGLHPGFSMITSRVHAHLQQEPHAHPPSCPPPIP
jgi:predicted kinase